MSFAYTAIEAEENEWPNAVEPDDWPADLDFIPPDGWSGDWPYPSEAQPPGYEPEYSLLLDMPSTVAMGEDGLTESFELVGLVLEGGTNPAYNLIGYNFEVWPYFKGASVPFSDGSDYKVFVATRLATGYVGFVESIVLDVGEDAEDGDAIDIDAEIAPESAKEQALFADVEDTASGVISLTEAPDFEIDSYSCSLYSVFDDPEEDPQYYASGLSAGGNGLNIRNFDYAIKGDVDYYVPSPSGPGGGSQTVGGMVWNGSEYVLGTYMQFEFGAVYGRAPLIVYIAKERALSLGTNPNPGLYADRIVVSGGDAMEAAWPDGGSVYDPIDESTSYYAAIYDGNIEISTDSPHIEMIGYRWDGGDYVAVREWNGSAYVLI